MSNIDLGDLQLFLTVAQHQNLPLAARECHVTPSALSRVIKRLEQQLSTVLFDRVGRQLRLNKDGERLRTRALELIGLAERTRNEFVGEGTRLHCRVLGPPLLQWRWSRPIADVLLERYPHTALAFEAEFEDKAIARLLRGEGDFALVTGDALRGVSSGDGKAGAKEKETVVDGELVAIALGQTITYLAASQAHALVRANMLSISTHEALQHDFICPRHSLFCGVNRGAASDGWRNDQMPRRIRLWADDLQVLLDWVKAGRALAYLPDFVLDMAELTRITVTDCPYICAEDMFLVYRRATASGWQRHLADRLVSAKKQ